MPRRIITTMRRSQLGPLGVPVVLMLAIALMGIVFSPSADAVAASCKPTSALVCITNTSSAHVTRVRVGERLDVVLGGSGMTFSALHELSPELLRPLGATTTRGGIVRATYLAVRAGRTGFQAMAAPRCGPGVACPQFILLWHAQVLVHR